MNRTPNEKLYKELQAALTERNFLKSMSMTAAQLQALLEKHNMKQLTDRIFEERDEKGRFSAVKVAEILAEPLAELGCVPECGWPVHTYEYVLGQLFPEKNAADGADECARGRKVYLRFLQMLFKYERLNLPFDPTVDIRFLRMQEIDAGGYNREYQRFDRMSRLQFVYEFMRIGTEITPWNTLGHIAGVHYVAMHVARQLAHMNVPVDLGMVSAAAASHDIGKYGCKKGEERRIPYLHYYYTDLCLNRFNMPMISHIAANHSTWDLELENLSVESLILIYADFRVKSSRVDGVEQVHFYSLAESFQVILDKLDNVDAAKELRYRKVYNKLVDFENYMRNLGVNVELPDVPAAVPELPEKLREKDAALLRNNEAVLKMKHIAVDHNIRLMNHFYREEDFANLLETARSEKQWRNLRTYISIFGAYSTYMTEHQKLLTLKFLYELHAHKESDIRVQAGEIVGQIIARFNVEYKKELPEGVRLPRKKITNLSLWEKYVRQSLQPDHKLTEQHRRWIGNCLQNMVHGLLNQCHESQRQDYIEALMPWFGARNLTPMNKEALLRAAVMIHPAWCTEKQKNTILSFAGKIIKNDEVDWKIAAVRVKEHYSGTGSDGVYSPAYYYELKQVMGLEPNRELREETLSVMFLENMKARTPWSVKIANINLMLKYLESDQGKGHELHVATHLGNLIKVSEMVTVRRFAGEGLISIIGKMPEEQRNEIAVELGKGLEIGDYQFTKYIPNYLGIVILHLRPQELDEMITDLTKMLVSGNGQVAAAVLHTFGVMLEHYRMYRQHFSGEESEEETRKRKRRLINLILRGLSHYDSVISFEALWTMGTHIFGSSHMTLEEKQEIFSHSCKKFLTLYNGQKEHGLDFFNNSAALNHIYRFITQYEADMGPVRIPETEKIAFFPGTFDPFSLGHKAIATRIRDMGYEVYLALDEFSWSKKTQPRMHRRRIMTMSVADEEGIYIFPDDIPVNIANPKDLTHLKELFSDRQIYFVAGSDVIENASCYRAEEQDCSIHSFNHIVFRRNSGQKPESGSDGEVRYPVSGQVVHFQLEPKYEEISSTRIRENIDLNRDISNLIDPVAQNYIFENSLYLREPTYKHMIQARDIHLEAYMSRDGEAADDLREELEDWGLDYDTVQAYLNRPDVRTVRIRDGVYGGKVVALAAVSRLDSIDLLKEFQDQEIATHIRAQAVGAIAVIGGLYYSKESSISHLGQTILTEVLSELLARDYTYVVYHPCHEKGMNSQVLELLTGQGFVNISSVASHPVYAANMKAPIIVFKNVEAFIKSPLNRNQNVLDVVETAHNRMLQVLKKLYPGNLLLSFNAGIMHHKMIRLIAEINGVPAVPREKKQYGPYMAVPFGKVLGEAVVPNTVTKTLHTEKYFDKDMSGFTIEEPVYYSPLQNQVKTIKSFNRPVILVDDLLHKGYRMKELDGILKENQVNVIKTVVGVQTGRGRDLMMTKGRDVESAYFLPNLRFWIDEIITYPYLGGDCIKDRNHSVSSYEFIPSMNLILPFAVPGFLGDVSPRCIYDYSMVCLENSRDILRVLEEEYQNEFERKLTLQRLGEVMMIPKYPELGEHVFLDENVAASACVEKDIERLVRMRNLFK